MRKLLLCLFLLPLQLLAQNSPQRELLDVAQSYRIALIEFARTNPDAVYNTSLGKTLFVKAQDFTKSLPDTAGSIHIKFINPETDAAAIAELLKKKQKLVILDMQQMLLRDLDMNIWIMPMKADFNGKKKTLSTPEYGTRGCQFIYDYGTNRTVYLYKESACKDLE